MDAQNLSPPIPPSRFHFESGQNGAQILVKFTVDETFPNVAPKDIRVMLHRDQSLELCKMTAVPHKGSTAASDSMGTPLDIDLVTLQKEVEAYVDEANKFGGHLSARVILGHSGFVVPRELADQVFAMADVYDLLETKRVAHFMINQLPASAHNAIDCAKRFYASNQSEWIPRRPVHNIKVLYSDQLIGSYDVATNGELVPDPNPPAGDKFLKGADLEKRGQAVTVVQEDGRIVVPECTSADFRIYGERMVDTQRTIVDTLFDSGDGFAARVTTATEYDHKVKRRQPDASQLQVVMDRKSLHAMPVNPPPKGENVYVVYVGVFLCPGQACDFQLLLSEHAPEEDAAPVEAIFPAVASRLLFSAVSDARAIIAAASLKA